MNAPDQLVVDLLLSLEAGPKPYREVMEAWRTSCPRLPVWEDAVDLGFVRCDRGMVALTDAGRKRLESAT
jgi:hypothetical protein